MDDKIQREEVLDITRSFIVQAPAGSGKTELLIQRYLALLQFCEKPEEIIAITFTRKAAAEMRQRVLSALQNVLAQKLPTTSHAHVTYQLATQVIRQDKNKQWELLNNPNRLRIFTIDSLCARIVRSSPLLSKFGGQSNVVENAQFYYQKAARALLFSLEENQNWSSDLEALLFHLDNRHDIAEKLFIDMLSMRDQWLPYIIGDNENLRKKLEEALKNIAKDNLTSCLSLIPPDIREEIAIVSRYAASQLLDTSPVSYCKDLLGFPNTDSDDLLQWKGIAELLLTQTNEWRKSVNKNQGFPSDGEFSKQMKKRMIDLLHRLEGKEDFRAALEAIKLSPPIAYTENQWEIVKSLLNILPILVAQLMLVFQEDNVVDFIEITLRAIKALGAVDAPTELALNMDYHIKHILIDEFQDTSNSQYRLLELLTAGWQPNDGKTLFLVGDPMQSIYRFREAEVGLFLRARREGIGSLNLVSLTLTHNFRSSSQVIHWINDTFSLLFPSMENINNGAISYTLSIAENTSLNGTSKVSTHLTVDEDDKQQAIKIADIIQETWEENSAATVAILVRSRQHLLEIIPHLKNENIAFQAVELEKLEDNTVIQDLYVLTRSLLYPADRLAWLSLLRSPWCGLTLSDIHALAGQDHQQPLWETLQNAETLNQVSEDGKNRLKRLVTVISHCIAQRRRYSLRQWITEAWYALGGPACIDSENDLTNAEVYFQLLDELECGGDLIDLDVLLEKLSQLYSTHTTSTNHQLQIMTIHKAKGLEFDVVIIPHLEKKSAIDDHQLLMWLERSRYEGTDLILAPIKAYDEEYEPIYRYIRLQENQKNQHEITRLLYVAATRAKRNLHLLATASSKEEKDEIKRPNAGSFLEILWPLFNSFFLKKKDKSGKELFVQTYTNSPHVLKRLTSSWILQASNRESSNVEIFQSSMYQLVRENHNSRHVGTVVHQSLQEIARDGLEVWSHKKIYQQRDFWKKKLMQLGVGLVDIDFAVDRIEEAITKTLENEKGRWILSNEHQNAMSEFAITALIDNKISHMVVDRTFIDQFGKCWIIDYKTSTPNENESVDNFVLKSKQCYYDQLEMYGQAMRLQINNPISLGLYFPLIPHWIEWDFHLRNE